MERNTRSPLCLMLEAVLFASGEPVPVSRLAQACEVSESAVQTALQQLAAWYEKQKSAICVQQLGDSWQMCTHPAYATVIQRAVETKKAAPLSAAAMEVLTIVAYNQPVSKSFVEHVRGVDSSSVVNTLVEKELLTEAGRLDVPGKPVIFSGASACSRWTSCRRCRCRLCRRKWYRSRRNLPIWQNDAEEASGLWLAG